jgi:hypothetical protein
MARRSGCTMMEGVGVALVPSAVRAPFQRVRREADDAGTRTADDSLALFGWILRHRVSSFSLRDVHRAFPRRFPTVAHADIALEALVDLGCIRRLPVPQRVPSAHNPKGAGRKPSPEFEVDWRVVSTFRRAWLAMQGSALRPA